MPICKIIIILTSYITLYIMWANSGRFLSIIPADSAEVVSAHNHENFAAHVVLIHQYCDLKCELLTLTSCVADPLVSASPI